MANHENPFDAIPTDADDEDDGVVAARCFRAAEQMKSGPVRDALLAMGRNYATRARETACTAAFRLELERSQREAPPGWLGRLVEVLMPASPQPAPAPPAARPAVQPRATVPAQPARPAAPARRPTSRLFRMHALATLGA